jgi:hypothetical protein
MLLSARHGFAYSVETHEQLIDLTWKSAIVPFLLRNYPATTAAELERAHAYAYGGCAIQDLGYYPFGNQFFSNLTHYVRSADFIQYMFLQAKDVYELAFAVGALSHYVGDTIGHRDAVNPSVSIEFPKLAKRYGPAATYEEDPHAHVRTEFAFDVNEISKHRMAPAAYLRHIGLRVPSALLARAFADTYGLDFERTVGRRRGIIRTYRFGVRSFLPRIAYAETVLHRKHFPADEQTPAFETFLRRLSDAEFEKQWNQYRKKAGIETLLLAWTIVILPKVGPFSLLAIRGPLPATHGRYIDSLNASADLMQRMLTQAGKRPRTFPNRDLDTGQTVSPGKYRLTDQTYAKLLDRLTSRPAASIPPGVKADIQKYYSDPNAPISTKKNASQWAEVQHELVVLEGMKTSRETYITEAADDDADQ